MNEEDEALKRMMDEMTYQSISHCMHVMFLKQKKEKDEEDTHKAQFLSTRFRFPPLNKVRVAASLIPGAGRGVFATCDIKRREVITFYPADVVFFKSTSQLLFSQDMLLEKTSQEQETFAKRFDYRLELNDQFAIATHPDFDSDMNFVSHIINDGCVTNPLHLTKEAYEAQQRQSMNCVHLPTKDQLYVVSVAYKDIAKNQEIVTSYGFGYWEWLFKNMNLKKQ